MIDCDEVWVEGGMITLLKPTCDFIAERRACDVVTDDMRSDEVKGDLAVASDLETVAFGSG